MKLRLCAIALLAAPALASAETVYSNLSGGIAIWNWNPGAPPPEFGDRVTLAGTARQLTSATYWLADVETPFTGTIDVTLRVYAVDAGTQLPGALLSQGTVEDFTYSSQNFFVTAAMAPATLPDDVFVSAEITATNAGRHGVVYTSGPTVGTNDPDHWYIHDTGGWTTMGGPGDGRGSLGLALNAVPEPASCTALALGALALLRRRRRAKP